MVDLLGILGKHRVHAAERGLASRKTNQLMSITKNSGKKRNVAIWDNAPVLFYLETREVSFISISLQSANIYL